MLRNPVFELFEIICDELASRNEIILPEDQINPDLIERIKKHFDKTDSGVAYLLALKLIEEHFDKRGLNLPYSFEESGRKFTVLDQSFIEFISSSVSNRGVGKYSATFEKKVLERLAMKLTGCLHRVGSPRKRFKKRKELGKYLEELGFERNALESRSKDAGFDILWLPPLGYIPIRSVIPIQCKNSSFDLADANNSVAAASTTMNRHSHMQAQDIHFVVFNDFIDERFIGRARGWKFLTLGLSDLANLKRTMNTNIL